MSKKTASGKTKSSADQRVQPVKAPATYVLKREVSDAAEGSGKVIGAEANDLVAFKALWERHADDPAKGPFLCLLAAYEYVHGNKSKGESMLTVTLSDVWKDPKSPTGFKLSVSDRTLFEQIAESPQIVDSYLGGTPNNDYRVDPTHLVMTVLSEGHDKDWCTVTIQSAGKAFSTPCNMGKDGTGRWKLLQIASMATGIQKAKWQGYQPRASFTGLGNPECYRDTALREREMIIRTRGGILSTYRTN